MHIHERINRCKVNMNAFYVTCEVKDALIVIERYVDAIRRDLLTNQQQPLPSSCSKGCMYAQRRMHSVVDGSD